MPAGQRVAPLALDRLAMARIEGGEEIVEGAVALIVPVELLVGALQEAMFGEKFPFGFAGKGDVNRGGLGGLAQRHQPARQRASAMRSRSTPSRISSRGPVAGVKGTEACSFG